MCKHSKGTKSLGIALSQGRGGLSQFTTWIEDNTVMLLQKSSHPSGLYKQEGSLQHRYNSC